MWMGLWRGKEVREGARWRRRGRARGVDGPVMGVEGTRTGGNEDRREQGRERAMGVTERCGARGVGAVAGCCKICGLQL